MKWSDGQPATSEDARWLIQTLLDGQKKDGYVGAGYLDPYLTYAGVTAVTAPDPQTLVLTTSPAEHADPDLVHPDPAQAHLGEARHRRRPERRRRSSAPARTRSPSGRPASTSAWSATRTTGARKGYADEIFFQFFKNEGAMTEALKAGDIDYARNVDPGPVRLAQGPAEHRDRRIVAGAEANAFTQLNFNTYSKPIKDGGAVDEGAPGPGLPGRPRLRHRQGGAGRQACSAGTASSAPRSSRRPWRAGSGTSSPTNPRTFDIELAKSEARRRRLQARRQRQAPRQGRQADQPAHGRARTARRPTARARSSSPAGGRARHRHDDAGARRRRR